MPFIAKYLFFTILMSPLLIFLGHSLKKKMIIISYAILNAILSSWLLLGEILSYGASESTLERKINLFFANDTSMFFYYVYIPLIIIGCILPATVYVIKCVGKKVIK